MLIGLPELYRPHRYLCLTGGRSSPATTRYPGADWSSTALAVVQPDRATGTFMRSFLYLPPPGAADRLIGEPRIAPPRIDYLAGASRRDWLSVGHVCAFN